MTFWNWLFFLKRNSKYKEVLLILVKSDVFFKDFFSKREQICRYLQVPLF